MAMIILVISDIHANFPALKAVEHFFSDQRPDLIFNCGDSVVYGPFPNETLAWLSTKADVSILGNTDKKVIKLLKGKTFAKPSNPEKRVMYTWTAETLDQPSSRLLKSFDKKASFTLEAGDAKLPRDWRIGIFHGSPAKNHEFLFTDTAEERFTELARQTTADIVVCGHSHDPFYKCISNVHFINPGSVGRMFDGNPSASCASLRLDADGLTVRHHRIAYDIDATIAGLRRASLPEIYCQMYRQGRKTH